MNKKGNVVGSEDKEERLQLTWKSEDCTVFKEASSRESVLQCHSYSFCWPSGTFSVYLIINLELVSSYTT